MYNYTQSTHDLHTYLNYIPEPIISEMCALLMKHNADMRMRSPVHGTPLHMAAKSKSESVIRLFIEKVLKICPKKCAEYWFNSRMKEKI